MAIDQEKTSAPIPHAPIDAVALALIDETGILMNHLGLPFNWQVVLEVFSHARPPQNEKKRAFTEAALHLSGLLLTMRAKLKEDIADSNTFFRSDPDTLSADPIVKSIQVVVAIMLRQLIDNKTIDTVYRKHHKKNQAKKPISPYHFGTVQ